MKTHVLVSALLFASLAAADAAGPTVASPDGRLRLSFDCTADGGLTYAFEADGKARILPSPLGLEGLAKPVLAGTKQRSVRTVWKPVWGKRAVVPDEFNELTLDLGSFRLAARAYDDAVAFRYEAPAGRDPRFYGWWGDMDLGPHLLAVLAQPRQGRITVTLHPPVPVAGHERKSLAAAAEHAVRSAA